MNEENKETVYGLAIVAAITLVSLVLVVVFFGFLAEYTLIVLGILIALMIVYAVGEEVIQLVRKLFGRSD